MRSVLFVVCSFILGVASVNAQGPPQSPEPAKAELPSAPTVWDRYRVDKHQVSFLFPKLPIVIGRTSACSEVDTREYHAYSEGSVYSVKVIAKIKSFPSSCPRITKFTPEVVMDELSKIRAEMTENSPATQEKQGLNVYKFTKAGRDLDVYEDEVKQRLVEVSINHLNDAKLNDDFLGSVVFESRDGKDIGDGADVTLGDASYPTMVTPGPTPKTPVVTSPLSIIAKPRAYYTDAARQASEQGSVRMKVTLLANGSVGSITPETTLKYGLTEQAIEAAKKIVFLPKRINGVPISTTLKFEYGFSIY